LDLLTIITLFATILTILGIIHQFVGGGSIVKWIKRRRTLQKKVQYMAPGIHQMAKSKKAKSSRSEYNKNLHYYARAHLDEKDIDIQEFLNQILSTHRNLTDATVSQDDISSSSVFVDCIGTAVTREGQTIAILPSGESTPDREGIGRTAVLLRLVGLTIRYGLLIGLRPDEFSMVDKISLYQSQKTPPWCKLLATDMMYVGSSGDSLSIIPTIGEKISFIWDISRHIFRTTDIDYRTGSHREETGRRKLLEIFRKIPIKPIYDLYGKTDIPYSIDNIIFLRRNAESDLSMPEWIDIEGDDRHEYLYKSLLVSTEHGSNFWDRDAEIESHIDAILNNINLSKIKSIGEISYSYPHRCAPTYIFDGISRLIKEGGKIAETSPNKLDDCVVATGIGEHNYVLTRSLYDVSKIRLLVTSGEKMFKDVCFWKALSQVENKMELEILMLDPESPKVRKREIAAYPELPDGFLKSEIKDNYITINRMREYFQKNQIEVDIRCGVYDKLAPFRMTFIGDNRHLIAPYGEGTRTGPETQFYELDALYDGFESLYKLYKESSKNLS
jgi:hypothetical protein